MTTAFVLSLILDSKSWISGCQPSSSTVLYSTGVPPKYFTKEILERLDEAAKKEFKYGDVVETSEETQDDQS